MFLVALICLLNKLFMVCEEISGNVDSGRRKSRFNSNSDPHHHVD